MISPVDIAFSDLMAVPGVRGVILVDGNSASRVYRLDFEMSRERIESLVRGVGQLVRRLGRATRRIDLRCAEGRFVIQALSEGVVVAILTDNKPNIPLLSLSLDQLSAATQVDYDRVLDTFKAGEILLLQSQEYQERPKYVEERRSNDPTTWTEQRPSGLGDREESASKEQSRPVRREAESALFAEFGETPSEAPPAPPTIAPASLPSSTTSGTTTGECASALTRASSVVARFLGRSVIANYWRQTATASMSGVFDVHQDGSIVALAPNTILSEQGRRSTVKWTADFLERCSLIVVDLPRELESTLDDAARGLLFGAN